MNYLLAILFFLASILQNDVSAHTKKRHGHTISRDAETRQLVTDCIARRHLPNARADIFAFFIASGNMRGSVKKLSYEICLAAYDDLNRFVTLMDIQNGSATGVLHRINSTYIAWPKELATERQVLREWATDYLITLTERAQVKGIALRVTSLTRPIELQKELGRRGASAAHCKEMILCSTHPTGAAFDLSIRNLSESERAWLAEELTADLKLKRILFILEARGGHFHIFVPRPQ